MVEHTGGVKPAIDTETMYTTWIAHNRNAASASKALGMSSATLRWHVSDKNWTARWEAEFNGAAEGIRKMAFIQAMQHVPTMLNVLVDIATTTGEGTSDIARVAAVREFFKVLPPPPKQEPEGYQSVVEVQGTMVHDNTIDVETAIRNELESNIIDAVEQRSRRGR